MTEEASQEQTQKNVDIIDKLLSEETQGFLIDYYTNTLFKEDTNFTKGLKFQDYDIVLSSSDAEGLEIFHSLNICNCKYDPNTPASKKVIHYEQLEKIMQNFLKWKNTREEDYKKNPNPRDYPAIYMHAYPMVRKNLSIDISTINFKEVKKNNLDSTIELMDYKIKKFNPEDKKDNIFFISFKLNGKKHKFGKIEQLLEQFKQSDLSQFWDFINKAYFVFCVEEERLIKIEYDLFPDWLKKANEENEHAKFLFYIDPPGEDEKQVMNIFKMSEFEKDYYFLINSQNLVYKSDSMLCSGDIVENNIKKRNEEEKDKKENKIYSEEDKNKALANFYDFVLNIKNYKYNFFFGYQFEVCLKFNEKNNLYVSYVQFSHLIAEVKTKEYQILKQIADIFKPDILELKEIETIDIPIDFKVNKCIKCKKDIPDKDEMYYCYKCKEKYCAKCVTDNFKNNKGLKRFIDPKHNLLYFKTRDLEQFKGIEKYKLGNDSFAKCQDETKLGKHSFSCNGCEAGQNYTDPRYLCISCRPGLMQDNGFNDYCVNCIEHMNKGDEKGKKMQVTKDLLYNQETRFFYEDKTTVNHDHNKHIYLMIVMEYKEKNENAYYDF